MSSCAREIPKFLPVGFSSVSIPSIWKVGSGSVFSSSRTAWVLAAWTTQSRRIPMRRHDLTASRSEMRMASMSSFSACFFVLRPLSSSSTAPRRSSIRAAGARA